MASIRSRHSVEGEHRNRNEWVLKCHIPDLLYEALCKDDFSSSFPFSIPFQGVLLVCDMSGFTAATEMLCAHEDGMSRLNDVLNFFHGELLHLVLSCESCNSRGDVYHFAGDSFIACWECAPNDIGTVFSEVLKCSFDIHEFASRDMHNDFPKFRMKCGIAAGSGSMLVTGSKQRRYFTASGLGVNVVAACERQASPGDTIVEYETWKKYIDIGGHARVATEEAIAEKEIDGEDLHYIKCCQFEGRSSLNFGSFPRGSVIQNDDSKRRKRFSFQRRSVVSSEISDRRASLFKKNIPVDIENDNNIGSKGDITWKEIKSLLFQCRPSNSTLTTEGSHVLSSFFPENLRVSLFMTQSLRWLNELRTITAAFFHVIPKPTNSAKSQKLEMDPDIYQLCVFNISDIVHESGGTINKALLYDKGCTILVVFGMPGEKHADDARRAVIASYKCLSLFSKTPPLDEFQLSVGVSTGRCFVGSIGSAARHEFSCLGDSVNLSARMMMGFPGIVSCCQDTRQCTSLDYFIELPPTTFKGKKEAITCFRVIPPDLHSIEDQFDNISSDEPEQSKNIADLTIIERPEMGTAFQRILKRINAELRQGVLFCIANAGMGKSRIMRYWCQKVRDLNQDTDNNSRSVSKNTVLKGHADQEDITTPYFFFRSLLRPILLSFDVDKGKGSSASRNEAVIKMAAQYVGPGSLAMLPVLNNILGASLCDTPLSEQIRGRSRFDAITNLIRNIIVGFHCANIGVEKKYETDSLSDLGGEEDDVFDHYTPASRGCRLFIFIEDAHWLDDMSWCLLSNFRESLPSAALVFFGRPSTANSKYIPSLFREIINGDKENEGNAVIALSPLTTDQINDLAGHLLNVSSIPAKLTYFLSEHCNGTPLLIEELLLDLQRKQVLNLRIENDDFIPDSKDNPNCRLRFSGPRRYIEINEDLTTLSTPSTVNEIMLTSVDALDGQLQYILRVASCLGFVFEPSILFAVINLLRVEDSVERMSNNSLFTKVLKLEGLGLINHHGDLKRGNSSKKMSENDVLTVLNGVTFTFKHIILKDVLYKLLMPDQRSRIHGRIAHFLSSKSEKDIHSLLHHFECANDVTNAFKWIVLAARSDIDNFCNHTAIELCRKALDIIRDGSLKVSKNQEAEVLELTATAYFRSSEYDLAIDFSMRALKKLGSTISLTRRGATLMILKEAIVQLLHRKLPRSLLRLYRETDSRAESINIQCRIFNTLILLLYSKNLQKPVTLAIFKSMNVSERLRKPPVDVMVRYSYMTIVFQLLGFPKLRNKYRERAYAVYKQYIECIRPNALSLLRNSEAIDELLLDDEIVSYIHVDYLIISCSIGFYGPFVEQCSKYLKFGFEVAQRVGDTVQCRTMGALITAYHLNCGGLYTTEQIYYDSYSSMIVTEGTSDVDWLGVHSAYNMSAYYYYQRGRFEEVESILDHMHALEHRPHQGACLTEIFLPLLVRLRMNHGSPSIVEDVRKDMLESSMFKSLHTDWSQWGTTQAYSACIEALIVLDMIICKNGRRYQGAIRMAQRIMKNWFKGVKIFACMRCRYYLYHAAIQHRSSLSRCRKSLLVALNVGVEYKSVPDLVNTLDHFRRIPSIGNNHDEEELISLAEELIQKSEFTSASCHLLWY